MSANVTSTVAWHQMYSALLSQLPNTMHDNPYKVSAFLGDGAWKTVAISIGLGYLLLVQALRFQRAKSLRRCYGFPDRASLKKMTVEDAQKIIVDLASLEFPLMSETSLQFGLFKVYEDTAVLIGEFIYNPPNSNRATTAVARMNWLHSKYITSGKILDTDLLYTLSVFITEPERFMRLYEWRSLNEMEHCAYGVFWKSIGDAMGIEYEGYLSKTEWIDGLDFALDIAQWAKSYEVIAFAPSQVSNKPAVTLIPMIAYWVPRFGKEFAYECVHVLLGDRVREAFLLPEPGIGAAALVYASLALRRFALRHLCLPRFVPLKRHNEVTDSVDAPLHIKWPYGNYPFYIKPTTWNRWGPGAWAVWLYGGKVPGDEPVEHMAQGYKFEDLGPRNRMGHGTDEMQSDFERLRTKGMGGCPFG
ncbi:hypothetical protein TruAng_008075 [Truncatella angustata]|nr:hypothetical protein TruAng_008075 [Truncatella angustata]